jgi:hypothetical protein
MTKSKRFLDAGGEADDKARALLRVAENTVGVRDACLCGFPLLCYVVQNGATEEMEN